MLIQLFFFLFAFSPSVTSDQRCHHSHGWREVWRSSEAQGKVRHALFCYLFEILKCCVWVSSVCTSLLIFMTIGALRTTGTLTKCWLMCTSQIKRSETTFLLSYCAWTVSKSISSGGKYSYSDWHLCECAHARVTSTLPYWTWEHRVLEWTLQFVQLSGSGSSRATRCWQCTTALRAWLMEW